MKAISTLGARLDFVKSVRRVSAGETSAKPEADLHAGSESPGRSQRKLTVRCRGGWLHLGVFLLLVFTATQTLLAATVVAGTCKPGGYPTVQQAIDAAPVGAKVEVCPGYYEEQIKITKALTLQGLTDSSGRIASVYSGDNPNATISYGDPVSADILVENSGGPVNISNIEAMSSVFQTRYAVGIFYQNSPGTINGVRTRGQWGTGGGIGILLEGGAAKPHVTVENSSIGEPDYAGVFVETGNQTDLEITANIEHNSVWMSGFPEGNATVSAGVIASGGAAVSMNGNVISGYDGYTYGLWIGPGVTGTVFSNSVDNAITDVATYADGVSITSNKIAALIGKAVDLHTALGAVKGNSIIGIITANVAVEFNCLANPNVGSNTITSFDVAFDHVPSAINTSSNKLFVVDKGRTGC